jgi:hypothetical protein
MVDPAEVEDRTRDGVGELVEPPQRVASDAGEVAPHALVVVAADHRAPVPAAEPEALDRRARAKIGPHPAVRRRRDMTRHVDSLVVSLASVQSLELGLGDL